VTGTPKINYTYKPTGNAQVKKRWASLCNFFKSIAQQGFQDIITIFRVNKTGTG
jgi:hypothetical protein